MSGGSAVEGNFFSLGQAGTITLSFEYPVLHVDSGLDLSFHEVTNGRTGYSEEKAKIEVSDDGSRWFNLGEVSSKDVDGVSYKDFTVDNLGILTTLTWVKYVRITDTTDFSLHINTADGYDLDAVDASNGTCEGDQDTEVCESLTGAIWTTDVQCETVNGNIFDSKLDVYLNGGPHGNGGSGLPDGNYYIRVTDPSGADILGESNPQTVAVVDGEFETCLNLYQLTNYSDTTNPAGEYKVWVSPEIDFPNQCSKTDNFKVESVTPTPTEEITPTPTLAKLFISKSNNKWPVDQKPGDNVTYTLTLTASESAVANIKLTDLPPGGFTYRVGSWKVFLNDIEINTVPEPVYHSPALWDLTSLGSITPEDKVRLEYIADISNSQELGLYKDLAWAYGNDTESNQVLAEAETLGYVDENFVGTQVNVINEQQSTTSINVVKNETQNGEVLGASTSNSNGLPATGANILWIVLASMLLIFGSCLIALGLFRKKLSKFFVKYIGVSLSLVILFSLFSMSAQASDFSIRLQEPKTPTYLNNFKINFVTLDIYNRPLTVKCYKKGPTDVDYIQFGSDILISAGGNTGYCNLDSGVFSDNGTYLFYASAQADAEIVFSQTDSIDYNTSGPSTPTEYSKDKPNSNQYKINFKTADDGGKTTKVEVYRSESTSFNIDSGTRVGTVTIGSNQNGSFTNDVPDSNKDYYFAIRAYDNFGNGSGVIGDSVIQTTTTTTTTTTSTNTTTSTEAIAPTAGGAIAVADVTLPTEDEEVLGEATGSAETGEVLGESTTKEEVVNANEKAKKNSIKYLIAGLLSVIILVSLIYALKKKKNKEEITIPPTPSIQ